MNAAARWGLLNDEIGEQDFDAMLMLPFCIMLRQEKNTTAYSYGTI